jgi:hypothetical protein
MDGKELSLSDSEGHVHIARGGALKSYWQLDITANNEVVMGLDK